MLISCTYALPLRHIPRLFVLALRWPLLLLRRRKRVGILFNVIEQGVLHGLELVLVGSKAARLEELINPSRRLLAPCLGHHEHFPQMNGYKNKFHGLK